MMKQITIYILTIFSFSFANAQTVLNYSDSLFSFNVSIDSMLSGDNINFDCYIKSISIYSKKSKKLIQMVAPPENSFWCSYPQDQIFLIDDINFDGMKDFMIIQFIPAGPNIPYFFWAFDKQTQQFERDTILEGITSPNFDQQQKLITSFWRASCCDHGLSTYKYINGEPTLIEETEIADDLDHPREQITTEKKLINGKMKLVKRTVEKVEQ